MKKTTFFGVLLCAASVVACSNEELVQQHENNSITMTAPDFVSAAGSRTSIDVNDSGGAFTWTENDTVGIFPNQGGQVYFPMTNGAGTKNATFNGGGWALKPASTYAAYYPYYILNKDLSKIDVSYEGQHQQGNASTALLGKYDFMAAKASTPANGYVNFHFAHLGCLVELNLIFPQAVDINEVSLNTTAQAFVEHGFIDLTADVPVITPTASSPTFHLSLLSLATTSKDEIVKVYFLMAPYDMDGLKVKVEANGYEGEFCGNTMQAGMAYKYTAIMQLQDTRWVDLGLSVKWAICNVGATAPEEMGNHYAWGEIATKTDYSGQTCLTDGKKLDLISGNAEYDVATALWGAPSRMPTKEEFDELLANCTNEWVTINGTPGRRFTSKKNGKSIFLPAAGRWFKTNHFGKESDGRYWAGTSYGRDDGGVCLRFGSNECRVNSSVRADGFSIRAVQ